MAAHPHTLAVARPCRWSGRWRSRARMAAHPHTHAPTRPRTRVARTRTRVHRRGFSRPIEYKYRTIFFFHKPLLDFRRFVTVSGRVVPGKKPTDRRRWPAVTQDEVLILTRDIMSVQSYRQK